MILEDQSHSDYWFKISRVIQFLSIWNPITPWSSKGSQDRTGWPSLLLLLYSHRELCPKSTTEDILKSVRYLRTYVDCILEVAHNAQSQLLSVVQVVRPTWFAGPLTYEWWCARTHTHTHTHMCALATTGPQNSQKAVERRSKYITFNHHEHLQSPRMTEFSPISQQARVFLSF